MDTWPRPLAALVAETGWVRWGELPTAGTPVLYADDRASALRAVGLSLTCVDPLGTAAGGWIAATGVSVQVEPLRRRSLQQARQDLVDAVEPGTTVVWLVPHGEMTVASARWAAANDVVRVGFDPQVGVSREQLHRLLQAVGVTVDL